MRMVVTRPSRLEPSSGFINLTIIESASLEDDKDNPCRTLGAFILSLQDTETEGEVDGGCIALPPSSTLRTIDCVWLCVAQLVGRCC